MKTTLVWSHGADSRTIIEGTMAVQGTGKWVFKPTYPMASSAAELRAAVNASSSDNRVKVSVQGTAYRIIGLEDLGFYLCESNRVASPSPTLAPAAETFDPPLDPGIAPYVLALREAGAETYEACQGGPDHAYPVPTIRFHGGTAEGLGVLAVAQAKRLPVAGLKRVWDLVDGEVTGPTWEMTFWRAADVKQRAAENLGGGSRAETGNQSAYPEQPDVGLFPADPDKPGRRILSAFDFCGELPGGAVLLESWVAHQTSTVRGRAVDKGDHVLVLRLFGGAKRMVVCSRRETYAFDLPADAASVPAAVPDVGPTEDVLAGCPVKLDSGVATAIKKACGAGEPEEIWLKARVGPDGFHVFSFQGRRICVAPDSLANIPVVCDAIATKILRDTQKDIKKPSDVWDVELTGRLTTGGLFLDRAETSVPGYRGASGIERIDAALSKLDGGDDAIEAAPPLSIPRLVARLESLDRAVREVLGEPTRLVPPLGAAWTLLDRYRMAWAALGRYGQNAVIAKIDRGMVAATPLSERKRESAPSPKTTPLFSPEKGPLHRYLQDVTRAAESAVADFILRALPTPLPEAVVSAEGRRAIQFAIAEAVDALAVPEALLPAKVADAGPTDAPRPAGGDEAPPASDTVGTSRERIAVIDAAVQRLTAPTRRPVSLLARHAHAAIVAALLAASEAQRQKSAKDGVQDVNFHIRAANELFKRALLPTLRQVSEDDIFSLTLLSALVGDLERVANELVEKPAVAATSNVCLSVE